MSRLSGNGSRTVNIGASEGVFLVRLDALQATGASPILATSTVRGGWALPYATMALASDPVGRAHGTRPALNDKPSCAPDFKPSYRFEIPPQESSLQ